MHQKIISYRINPVWDIVHRIREDIKNQLSEMGDELCNASVMTAAELLENAIKYSGSDEKYSEIAFRIQADRHNIQIIISNPVCSAEDAQEMKTCIDHINASDNPGALYTQRMIFLMENPCSEKTCLGLYRIAYEGSFSLQYHVNQHSATITATRYIQTGESPE